MTEARGRAKPLSPEDRRRAIIEAVVPLLDPEGGPITTRQIAEAAGIAEGTIFRVFPDKPSLFFAVAESVVDPSVAAEQLRTSLEPAVDLRSRLIITIKYLLERTSRMIVVMHSLRASIAEHSGVQGHGEHSASTQDVLTNASQAMRETIARLVFDPHRDELGVPSDVAATALHALVFGFAHPVMAPTGRPDPESLASILLDGIYSGGSR